MPKNKLIPYVKIEFAESSENVTLWDSKLFGDPYFPEDQEYPRSAAGDPLCLLAQFNCADVPTIPNLDFPKEGILQFYMHFDPGVGVVDPSCHRVLYFPTIDQTEERLITDFSFVDRDLFDYDSVRLNFTVAQGLFEDARAWADDDDPEAAEDEAIATESELEVGGPFYEDEEELKNGGRIGGYPTLIQNDFLIQSLYATGDSPFVDLDDDALALRFYKGSEYIERKRDKDKPFRLLLEMVWDCDHFFYYIQDAALRNRDFSEIVFDFD